MRASPGFPLCFFSCRGSLRQPQSDAGLNRGLDFRMMRSAQYAAAPDEHLLRCPQSKVFSNGERESAKPGRREADRSANEKRLNRL